MNTGGTWTTSFCTPRRRNSVLKSWDEVGKIQGCLWLLQGKLSTQQLPAEFQCDNAEAFSRHCWTYMSLGSYFQNRIAMRISSYISRDIEPVTVRSAEKEVPEKHFWFRYSTKDRNLETFPFYLLPLYANCFIPNSNGMSVNMSRRMGNSFVKGHNFECQNFILNRQFWKRTLNDMCPLLSLGFLRTATTDTYLLRLMFRSTTALPPE
jgi:hypothetical protein